MSADKRSDDDGSANACTFFMLDADFVRKFPGKSLPFFQEIRDKFIDNEPLVKVALDYADVVKGTHIEATLAVSHRWMQPDDPDPDGEQLKALKGFLDSPAGTKIERVWIDSACMPQDHPKGSRSAEDTAAFKRMLKEVNRLYLGTTVLILLDLSYVARFWTQFESWMSMQFATPDGLKPAVGTKNERHHIVCIENAAEQSELHEKMLLQSWATKTPQQAHDFLSKPDVTVTNQKDKEGQLPKIKALDATVQGAFSEVSRQIEDELAASEAAVARAEAELAAWETENDAKAGEKNQLTVAARQAASAVASARMAKEEYAQAASAGLVLATMKRGAALAEKEKEAAVKAAEEAHQEKSRLLRERDRIARVRLYDVPTLVWQLHSSAIVTEVGIAQLVALARDGTDGQKEGAAGALAELALNADNQLAIARADGVAPLVTLARCGTDGQKEQAAWALWNLSYNKTNLTAMKDLGYGMKSFFGGWTVTKAEDTIPSEVRRWVEQLRIGGDGQKEQAGRELWRLAGNADNQVAIAKAGGIPPLVALARGGTDGQKEQAAGVLWALSQNADNQVAIATAGGIPPLVALARDGTDVREWSYRSFRSFGTVIVNGGGMGGKLAAAGALAELALNADNQLAIARAGGIAPLVALARKAQKDRRMYEHKKIAAGALRNLGCTKSMFGWKIPKALA